METAIPDAACESAMSTLFHGQIAPNRTFTFCHRPEEKSPPKRALVIDLIARQCCACETTLGCVFGSNRVMMAPSNATPASV